MSVDESLVVPFFNWFRMEKGNCYVTEITVLKGVRTVPICVMDIGINIEILTCVV